MQKIVQHFCAAKNLKKKIAQAKEEFLDSCRGKELILGKKNFSCAEVRSILDM